MNAHQLVIPGFTLLNALAAVLIAFVFISLMSTVSQPGRQKLNAILIAGAGSVYWNGGLGIWEYVFGAVMLALAYKGLKSYYFIGIGWLLHSAWDILHHLSGQPIIIFAPNSSAGCAVCDPILALWFFMGAPTILNFKRIWLKNRKP
ncbi:DUF6010 family protein [Arachidicoccus ginsenosidivorans]|uniref:Integral membrane protein n=1 Tax=Arachidicoccus ginsenosidivorans TaxID=496057 RepID=A0A5B8VQ70_9BACT|nr:DUF6010 family protein [Arachidicoccus ginsenosidivorans]QEC73784.1 hypothetical protein FSB73_21050 [Arachidicoccus ginsenosidivorans]